LTALQDFDTSNPYFHHWSNSSARWKTHSCRGNDVS